MATLKENLERITPGNKKLLVEWPIEYDDIKDMTLDELKKVLNVDASRLKHHITELDIIIERLTDISLHEEALWNKMKKKIKSVK